MAGGDRETESQKKEKKYRLVLLSILFCSDSSLVGVNEICQLALSKESNSVIGCVILLEENYFGTPTSP